VASNNELKQSILEAVKQAQVGALERLDIYANPATTNYKNEFLFFLKPELTEASEAIRLDTILDIVLDKIHQFGLSISNVSIIGAVYLDKFDIIAQHYGVINQLARDAKANISETAKAKFTEAYGKDVNEVALVGGFEFLNKYPTFNATSLDILWQQPDNIKLSGGTYSESVRIDGSEIFLVNGFHPRQLAHFTDRGRSIVTMTLTGETNWSVARNDFVGITKPQNANIGSLRRILLDKKAELGLKEVSQGVNGVHLSAGPVEGLVELIRYNSDFRDRGKIRSHLDFTFGKKLSESFTTAQVMDIISNKKVMINGQEISVFDLTEEQDSDDAMRELLLIFPQLDQAYKG